MMTMTTGGSSMVNGSGNDNSSSVSSNNPNKGFTTITTMSTKSSEVGDLSSLPPALLCSSSSITPRIDGQQEPQSHSEHYHHQQQPQSSQQQNNGEGGTITTATAITAATTTDADAAAGEDAVVTFTSTTGVCDDSSYFDGDWVSTTVQSAVTHFFGNDTDVAENDNDNLQTKASSSKNNLIGNANHENGNKGNPVQMGGNKEATKNVQAKEGEELRSILLPPLITSPSALSSIVGGFSSSNETKNDTGEQQPSQIAVEPTSTRSFLGGIYDQLHCDGTTANRSASDTIDEIANNSSEAGPQHNHSQLSSPIDCQPQAFLLPSDFNPQTWLEVLQSSPSVRYTAGAAAALTAVIVIHPLAIIGAATGVAAGAVGAVASVGTVPIVGTIGAVGAGATMWAVGFFEDLERGYQIWRSEEFGMLFWEDRDAKAANDGAIGDSSTKNIGAQDVEQNLAVAKTNQGQQTGDEEEHERRRVFLLEQERQKMGEKVRVVKVDEDSGEILHKVEAVGDAASSDKNTATSSLSVVTEAVVANSTRDVVDKMSVSSRTMARDKKMSHQHHQSQQSKKGYGLRRIKSAPFGSFKSSTTSSNSHAADTLEKHRQALSAKKQEQSVAALAVPEKFRKIKSTSSSGSAQTKVEHPKQEQSAQSQTHSPALDSSTKASLSKASSQNHALKSDKTKAATSTIRTPTSTISISQYFPPLQTCVIHSHPLPGLDTPRRFFDVFFSNDAPYSMKDFQKRRGDVDIVYGQWESLHDGDGGEGGGLYSFMSGGEHDDLTPLPPNSTQERTLKFNTLTKSYFGPAYAKATKTQRATYLSDHVLVIENKTQLAEIPYSERFCVVERWVVEVAEETEEDERMGVKNNRDVAAKKRRQRPLTPQNNGNDGMDRDHASHVNTSTSTNTTTMCKLTVHAEVQMLKPCTWESQIRKKASETFTEVLSEWCKSATVALKATEEQRRKRLRLDDSSAAKNGGGRVIGSGNGLDNSTGNNSDLAIATEHQRLSSPDLPPPLMSPKTPISARQSELFAKHRRNFDELDKLIAKGDLEWCSVEVMHSRNNTSGSSNGDGFATVLEYPSLNEYEVTPSLSGVAEYNDNSSMMLDGPRRRAATVIMRRKSRKLFKKLSSRVSSKSLTKQLPR